MEIVRGIGPDIVRRPCAITVGTFDGLHKGHRRIIERLKTEAAERRLCTTLVTFDPHPKVVVRPDLAKQLGLLTTLDEKIELLRETGIDRIVVIPFDKDFSQTPYARFVREVLIDHLGAKAVIVGYDHGFGKNREGDFSKLQALSRAYGFHAEQIGPFDFEGEIISSTMIRNLILAGNVRDVKNYLGRPYILHGRVVKGNNIGQKYNYPTANLNVNDPYKLMPANGVYAVDVVFENRKYKGMLNMGFKPTFGMNQHTIETHIFDFEGNLYNKYLTVYLKERLRDEKKFESVEALIKQLEIDKKKSLLI